MITATQEAEVGRSLEPGRLRLQRVMIMPLHSSLGDRDPVSKKKQSGQGITNMDKKIIKDYDKIDVRVTVTQEEVEVTGVGG